MTGLSSVPLEPCWAARESVPTMQLFATGWLVMESEREREGVHTVHWACLGCCGWVHPRMHDMSRFCKSQTDRVVVWERVANGLGYHGSSIPLPGMLGVRTAGGEEGLRAASYQHRHRGRHHLLYKSHFRALSRSPIMPYRPSAEFSDQKCGRKRGRL